MIVALITTQAKIVGARDYRLQDWAMAGLRATSIFRCFIVTLPSFANLVVIGLLSEGDWQGVKACVKTSLTGLEP